jgi:hypothetical protein
MVVPYLLDLNPQKKGWRRAGLGGSASRLFVEAERAARARGVETLRLTVLANDPALGALPQTRQGRARPLPTRISRCRPLPRRCAGEQARELAEHRDQAQMSKRLVDASARALVFGAWAVTSRWTAGTALASLLSEADFAARKAQRAIALGRQSAPLATIRRAA